MSKAQTGAAELRGSGADAELPTPVSIAWPAARQAAHAAVGDPLPAIVLRLDEAEGHILAEPVATLTPIPAFTSSAMDGYAVGGLAGPWRVSRRVLAGDQDSAAIAHDEAVAIGTGALLPPGTVAVLRWEHARLDDETAADDMTTTWLHDEAGQLTAGKEIRPIGEEAAAGTPLVPAGMRIDPAVIGVAATAGHDTLVVRPWPVVDILLFGDELVTSGPSREGQIRDSLGPQLPGWLRRLGAQHRRSLYVKDTLADHLAALSTASETGVDLIVTTGGTAAGPVDHLHAALRELDARFIVDSVAVRPGHWQLLAEIARPGGAVYVIGLPGNALSAVASLLTVGWSTIRAMQGLPVLTLGSCRLATDVPASADEHRLIPVTLDSSGLAVPTGHRGSAMLRGLVGAIGLAVAPPGGAAAGDIVPLLPLP